MVKKETQNLKENIAVLDEKLLVEKIQKIVGSKTNIKKIVSKIKSDKKFMEEFNKATEEKQVALLKNKLKSVLEDVNKELSENKKKQVANALKGLVTAITSVRWKGASDPRFLKLPKQIQGKIKYYVEAKARKDKKNGIRVPGFKLSLDFGKDIPLIEENSMTFVVNPYVITGVFNNLRKVVSINTGRTKVFEGGIRGDEKKQKANELNVRIKKMSPEQQALWILSEWLNLKEDVLLKLVEKGGILNKLYEAIVEYIKIYQNGIEEGDEKIKENAKKIKDNKEAPANVVLVTKFDDLKNTNYSRRYQGSYYGSALIVGDTKHIYTSKVVDKRYTGKPDYVRETMENMVKFLWNLKYKDVDGKVKRVFDVLELAGILNTVLSELKQTGDIEDFKPVDVDRLKGVKDVIEKIKKALTKDTKKKVSIRDGVISIEGYKQLKQEYGLTQDFTEENLTKWKNALTKELGEEDINNVTLKRFAINGIEFVINDKTGVATVSLGNTKITNLKGGISDDNKALEFIGQYVDGKNKGEIHLSRKSPKKVQQLLELLKDEKKLGVLGYLYVLILAFIEVVFATDTDLIKQIAKTASEVRVKEEVDPTEEETTRKETVSKDVVTSTGKGIQDKVGVTNNLLEAQI